MRYECLNNRQPILWLVGPLFQGYVISELCCNFLLLSDEHLTLQRADRDVVKEARTQEALLSGLPYIENGKTEGLSVLLDAELGPIA